MTKFEAWMIVLTAIYVFGTLALFWAGLYQIRRYNKELRHQSVIHATASNQELIFLSIKHPELFKLFRFEEAPEDEKLSRYAQLWINQAYVIWHSYKMGSLSDLEWKPYVYDLRYFFENPVVKKRWEIAKNTTIENLFL